MQCNTIKVKYLTGRDASAIAASGDTPAVQNTEIVVHSVVWDDDRSLAVRKKWAKALSLADRKVIVKAVLDDQPGPRLEEVNAPCAYCSKEISIRLTLIMYIGIMTPFLKVTPATHYETLSPCLSGRDRFGVPWLGGTRNA